MLNPMLYGQQFMRIKVDGIPAPKGSKALMPNGRMVEVSPRLKEWNKALAAAIKDQHPFIAIETRPIHVEIEFRMPRPKSRKTGLWHDTRPDIDKLARAVLDELTKQMVIDDDSQVARLTVTKKYTVADQNETPGCVIEGWVL